MRAPILRTVPILPGPMPTPDPFLFCVYHKDEYPEGPIHKTMEAPYPGNGHDFDPNAPYRMYHGTKIPGFPKHPHRGFETITATIKGIVDHADSLGNAGRYGEGDVQWMTAGKGVVHGEMFPLVNIDEPNHTEFFQIWLNLPKKDKMVDPSFAMFWANDVPKYVSPDGKAHVTSWFGDYFVNDDNAGNETAARNSPPPDSWASDPRNDVAVLHLIIQPGGSLMLPPSKTKNVNRSLYLVKGFEQGVKIGDKLMHEKVILEMDASEEVEISVSDSATGGVGAVEFLMLQGKPIGEPVVQHGPFVMNTRAEISQTFDDYSKTGFGGWPWPESEMVFPQDKGRFSLLDGVETFPTGEGKEDDEVETCESDSVNEKQ